MSKLNLSLAMLVILGSSALLNADAKSAVSSGDLKVCYIDVFAAMRESEQGMQEAEKLECTRKELTKVIETEGKRYETAVNKYKSESSTLNDSARGKKEQEIVKMKRDYENLVAGSEEQMKLAMQQTTELLAKEVESAVVEVAKQEKIHSVIDKVTGKVIYSEPQMDYTAKVVDSMNKNFHVKIASNERSTSTTVVAHKQSATKPSTRPA